MWQSIKRIPFDRETTNLKETNVAKDFHIVKRYWESPNTCYNQALSLMMRGATNVQKSIRRFCLLNKCRTVFNPMCFGVDILIALLALLGAKLV